MPSVLKTALSKAASPGRLIPRLSAHPPAWTAVAAPGRSISDTNRRAADRQAQPLGPYYELLLDDPPPYGPLKPKAGSPPPPGPERPNRSRDPEPSPGQEAAQTSPPKPGIVFGSALAGPAARAERLAAVRSRSITVAGVLVPPKPEEPDNCCMSGCVNCVWDQYREEMEEWATASAEADSRLLAQKKTQQQAAADEGGRSSSSATLEVEPDASGAVSMDDDGGGSDTNWTSAEVSPKIAKDLWDDGLYRNVPVGIREFMKQEKRLKEKHRLEGTSGG